MDAPRLRVGDLVFDFDHRKLYPVTALVKSDDVINVTLNNEQTDLPIHASVYVLLTVETPTDETCKK